MTIQEIVKRALAEVRDKGAPLTPDPIFMRRFSAAMPSGRM